MSISKTLFPVLACALLLSACAYIVLPEAGETEVVGEWNAVATAVGKTDAGDLRIELALQNATGAWSAMKATPDKPAVLTSEDKTTNCDTVFVSSGGHRLAPGFQLRGYIAGKKAEPQTQLIYVECKGAAAAPGATLAIPYSFVTGQYNYYEPEANKVEGTLEVNLDEIAADLKYPLAEPVDGLIQKADTKITALNDVALTLTDIQRTDKGLQFKWQTENPGEYGSYLHIGNPPVIGADGILYGFYETPDIVNVPITPAGGKIEWTTEVAAPEAVKGFYIMLSVETGKARLFTNYAVDITDK